MSSSKNGRVFFAHPSSYSIPEIEKDSVEISKILVEEFPKASFQVRAGRADFSENYLGNWEEWCRSVVERKHPLGGPMFHIFITPEVELGKATADILRRALRQGKRRVYYNRIEEGRLETVKSIKEVDSLNFISGWKAIV